MKKGRHTELGSFMVKGLRCLLVPAVRFSIRHNLSFQELSAAAKRIFVEIFVEELERAGEKTSVSRISLGTGLRRREVLRLLGEGGQGNERTPAESSILMRIIGSWMIDPRFNTSNGTPRTLSLRGEDNEFARLVRNITTDVSPGTVLMELIRIGVVEVNDGLVELVKTAYEAREDVLESFKLLELDLSDLALAVEENLLPEPELRNHHATTEFTNISQDKLELLRSWLLREGAALHDRLRRYLSKYDKDFNAKLKGPGSARVVFGSFSRLELPKEVRRSQKIKVKRQVK